MGMERVSFLEEPSAVASEHFLALEFFPEQGKWGIAWTYWFSWAETQEVRDTNPTNICLPCRINSIKSGTTKSFLQVILPSLKSSSWMQQVSFQRALLPPKLSNNIYPEEAVCLPQSDPKSCLHEPMNFSEIMLLTKKMVSLLITERKLPTSRGVWERLRCDHYGESPLGRFAQFFTLCFFVSTFHHIINHVVFLYLHGLPLS